MKKIYSVEEAAFNLAREGFKHHFGRPGIPTRADPIWRALRDVGTRLWLDTGDVEEAGRLWSAEFEALTTNNTLLNKEVQKGTYDDLAKRAASTLRGASPPCSESDLILEIAFVLNARHGLTLVTRFDAFVSVEVHTDLVNNVERTVEYGRRFYAICPERFYIKVPLSPAGLISARRLSLLGIPVNLTLGFSARQNVLAALVAQPAFANVFMGRLNVFVSDNALGNGRNFGEKATLATQRELLELREEGHSRARLIGASMRDGSQVGTLAGIDVFTMPPKVAAQYRGDPLPSVESQIRNDPEVKVAGGVMMDDFGAPALWEVPPGLKACAADLAAIAPDRLTPAEIVERLVGAGFADLFPHWSFADIRTAASDGKIPVYAHWKDRLASRNIGLDALMNLSAWQSFAVDQSALDARITSLIG